MQANPFDHPLDPSNSLLNLSSGLGDEVDAVIDESQFVSEPMYFHGCYSSCMEMFALTSEVARYLDAHRDWFARCAHPMRTNPLGENGYELTIGQFGSFGYEVEPKIGLNLLPQEQGVYRIQTIPVPNYEPPGYNVDFQAALQLVEMDTDRDLYCLPANGESTALPSKMTRVEWDLNLEVAIQFPRFIHSLPKSLIQSTGDRLLNQIVRQVSRRLTHKVQEDFHSTHGLTLARRRKKYPWG